MTFAHGFTATLALALGATTALAFDLSSVETRKINGLVGPTQAAKVRPFVHAVQPLEAEGIASLAGRSLRTRFWAIEGPGGVVPIHDHSNRPASLVVVSGEVQEYSNLSNERIHHHTGGLSLEQGDVAHWWLNEGEETVHLVAFDVMPVAQDPAAVAVAQVPQAQALDLPAKRAAQNDLLGVVDLGAHFGGAYGEGWVLSTYRATISPGGILPAFTGAGEPAQPFVWQGTITEHRSDTDAPVVLAERTGSSLAGGVSAWWQNTGEADAIVYFGVVERASEVDGVPQVGQKAHAH